METNGWKKTKERQRPYLIEYRKTYWHNYVAVVQETTFFSSSKPVFIASTGILSFPEGKIFKTKSEALKHIKAYMRNN